MRKQWLICLAALVGGCIGGLNGAGPLKTVSFVDLSRYVGKWYQVAHYPSFFLNGCASSTAEYTANPDGSIGVFNTCLGDDGLAKGTITGTATVVDTGSNAKLKVRFPNVPVAGDYWIIALDDDYEYAVVSDPTRLSLFVLSRTPTVTQDQLDAILNILDSSGFDLNKIVYDKPAAVE